MDLSKVMKLMPFLRKKILPFGEETKTEYNTLFDNITVSENGSFFGSGVLYGAFDFDIVNNFTVIFDGVEYNYEVTPKPADTSYLGNKTLANLLNPGENTNEPFCIAADFFFNVDDMSEDVNDRIYLAEPGVNHTLTIKKKVEQTVITPLPAKYIGFNLNFTVNPDDFSITADKTPAEVRQAFDEGKEIIAKAYYTGGILVMTNLSVSQALNGKNLYFNGCGADVESFTTGTFSAVRFAVVYGDVTNNTWQLAITQIPVSN